MFLVAFTRRLRGDFIVKKLFLTSVAMGAVLAAAGAAQAADPVPVVTSPVVVTPAPMPVPDHHTWTGGYIGGHAGFARGAIFDGLTCEDDNGPATAYFFIEFPNEDLDEDGDCDWNALVGTLDPDQDAFEPKFVIQDETVPGLAGYLAGAQIGFNYQFGDGPNGFVVGAEVAHSFANIGVEFQSYSDEFDIEWNDEFEISRLTTATLRAGFAFGRALVYGEVGIALAQASWTDSQGFHDTDMAKGIVWGAGIEVGFGDRLSIFFEYNRVKLEHQFLGQVEVSPGIGLPVQNFPALVGVDSTTNIFKVGFNIGVGPH